MTKNERAFIVGVLQAAQAWAKQCKATDYVSLITKWLGVTATHELTEDDHG
jgi:hypothetical protein